MKKKMIILLFILLVAIALLIVRSNDSKETKDDNVIRIGISLPLTGVVGHAGQPAKAATEMALEKWKEKGTKYDYELIIEDDQLDPKITAMVGNKLMNADGVDAILGMWGYSSKIFAEANNMRKNPIPHITCSWGTSLTQGDYNFNNVPSVETYANKLISKFKAEGIRNVGFVFQQSSSDLEMREVIIDKINEANINVTFNEVFNIGEQDYRTFLAKVKSKPTEIIYFQLLPGDLYVFHKQMNEMGMNMPLTTLDYFDDLEDSTPFEGYWFVTSNVGDREFIENFKSSQKLEIRGCTLNTYDSVDILINAFENAKSEDGHKPSASNVVKYIQSLETWDGVVGKLKIGEDGHIDYEPKLAIIKNGKTELLEE